VITLDPPPLQARGITIFGDSDDPDQFYFLPPAPKLAPAGDGVSFTLYKYRRDLTDNPELDPTRAKGAGLALFEVETPVANTAAIQAEVAGATERPNARLSPIVFRSGTVAAIIAHVDGDNFVEDLVNSRAAPLTYPHHAAFAMALSAEGATLFEAAARGGQLPVGVAYELRFLALTPSLHARVHMDYDRIYDHFATGLGFTYYVSAKLDLELAWLVEHDLVKIEIVAFTDDDDRNRQQQLVMDLVRARIEGDFFRSTVPEEEEQGIAGPLGQLLGGMVGGKKVTSASAYFVLKAKWESVKERKDFDLLFDGRTAVELTHVCTGTLATIIGDGPAPTIRSIDTDDPFFSSLDVQVVSTIDFDEIADLSAAAATVAYHDHRDSFEFSPTQAGPYRFQSPLARARDDEYEYTAEYHFDSASGGGPTPVHAGPFRSRGRVLVIDPLEHFRYVRLDVLLGPVDPVQVPRIRVQLRIAGADGQPDLVRDTVELDAQHPKVVWRQHLPVDAEPPTIYARTEWEDAHGTSHRGDEQQVTGDSFVALGPFQDVLEVSVVSAADWRRTTQVYVELRYQDGDYVVDRSLTLAPGADGAPPAAQQVEIPLMDPAKRTYSWHELILRADGTTSQSDWTDAKGSFLVVGREPPPPGQIRVVWVGDPDGAFGLQIDFFATDASGAEENVAVFIRAGEKEATALLPLDAGGHLHYRYEVRRISAGGSDLLRSGEGESNLLVVQAAG
jgi:hypothetical protein